MSVTAIKKVCDTFLLQWGRYCNKIFRKAWEEELDKVGLQNYIKWTIKDFNSANS